MADRLVDRSMKARRAGRDKNALLILEEAVHLLRAAPVSLLPVYYAGSLPFVLGFLYFWADMSRSATAQEHCAVAALAVALLFVWMKVWQAVFTARIRARIQDRPLSHAARPGILQRVAHQTLIQATGLIVLPLAALMLLPFGWCFAFYQNITVEGLQGSPDLKSRAREAWQQACLWPRQNHIMLAVISFFGSVVLLNVAMGIFILPHLFKKLLGLESLFTLSGLNMINTTFWAAVVGIAYLCTDPVIKTAYTLRCFYGAATRSGDDLKAELNLLFPGAGKIVSVALIFLLAAAPLSALAGQRPAPAAGAFKTNAKPTSGRRFSISAPLLDRSIETVLKRPEFSWRLPRKISRSGPQKHRGPVAQAVAWLIKMLHEGVSVVMAWIEKLVDWLAKLWPQKTSPRAAPNARWVDSVRVVVILLLLGLCGVLVYVLGRAWQRGRVSKKEIAVRTVPSQPDLDNEGVKADELPADRWLALAKELADRGSLRLALRALYLATLAHLADQQMITIEIYKSNHEYALELRRRAHAKQDLLAAFASSLTFFERIWYGMGKITRPDLENFAATQKKIMATAGSPGLFEF